MYSKIKKVILNIIPKKVLFRYEYSFRYLYYLLYIGNSYQCNVCNKKIRSFVNVEDEKLCPRCGSIKRTRKLWQILNDGFLKDGHKILDFSPSRSIYRKMKKGNFVYASSDLSGDFISDYSYDITDIDLDDKTYDLIICYHILEHIDNDAKAMEELWRILRKGGHCIVQTPFKEGDIFEDKSIVTPKEREKHFGQDDHVRIYSIKGLKSRLENVGFIVETKNYTEKQKNIHGFNEEETVLICSKS